MEHYSLQVTTLTMYAGMYYVTGIHYTYMQGDGVKYFFLLIVVLPNLIFLYYWCNMFRIEMLKIALMRGRGTFKMLTCGLIDVDEFEKTHMLEDIDENDVLAKIPKMTKTGSKNKDKPFEQQSPDLKGDFTNIAKIQNERPDSK